MCYINGSLHYYPAAGKCSSGLRRVETGRLYDALHPAPASGLRPNGGHFMLRDIYDQPRAVVDTIMEWLDDAAGLLDETGLDAKISRLRRLHIVACGSSYNAALAGRYMLEKFVHIPVSVDTASEYRYIGPVTTNGTMMIAITQSGETGDVIEAQRVAKGKGATVLNICNESCSTASKEADFVFLTRAGTERGTVSTKAFTAQLAALCLLGLAIGKKKGCLHDIEIDTMRSLLAGLPCLIEKALLTEERIRTVAGSLENAKGLIFLGRGINYPIALEGALKMKEVAYVHAGGYPTGEIPHGPMALVEEGVSAIFLAPIDGLDDLVLRGMRDVKARGGRVIAVTDAPALLRDLVDDMIVIPSAHPALTPFLTIVPLQLLAYHAGVVKGHNVDRPRNLQKIVGTMPVAT